jgi:hypothetical protein
MKKVQITQSKIKQYRISKDANIDLAIDEIANELLKSPQYCYICIIPT